MTIDPVLICLHCGKPTLHLFVEMRARRPTPKEEPCADLIYACEDCGEERRWGNAVRDETAWQRREDSILAHAVEVHGLRSETCPACKGAARGCVECDGEGEVMFFESPEPCGTGCPLDRHEREGTC
jgi:hypothetical protein